MARGREEQESGLTDTAQLLGDLVAFVRRFVVLSDAQAAGVALWIAHSHGFEAADTTSYLSITSAEMRSGKTRLLEVLELLVRGLAEALELTLLLADEEDARYERAALRWHVRFVYETKNVDLRESVAVLALLMAIPANRLAAAALSELFSRRRSLERCAEALVR
jgi:hypothetical protein